MPLCVDGLVVVASISLVELAGRLRALDAATAAAAAEANRVAAAQPAAARKATGPRAATRAPAKKTTRPAKTTSPRKAPDTSAPVAAAPLPEGTVATTQGASIATDATGPADLAAQPQLASVAA